MKVKITGISGYLGKIISEELILKGHEVSGIERKLLYGPIDNLMSQIEGTDVIINLAGAPIFQRWTKKNRTIIYESRVKSTRNLVQTINNLPKNKQPVKFISASAIGIYKPGFEHDETSVNFEAGFIGKVVKDWENASSELAPYIQKNILRIGLVLGENAKTIKQLLLPFKLGLGGTIGNGRQAFPFIHEKDLVNAFIYTIEELTTNGTFNLVAPENITNKDFTKALAKKVNMPSIIPVPKFFVKLIFGKASELILKSPVVEPKALLKNNFEFAYPTIEATLSEILNKKTPS